MIADLTILKEQLRVDFDDDDATIGRKIAAAQDLIERHLGFKIEDEFGGAGQEEIPPALVEAVCQLVGHWFENREAVIVGVNAQELPLNVRDIIREYRNWSW
ncbi:MULTISPECIES: head-tail connector protein [unclassified Shinella]|uniref:head-tail connector protein n=1 Tax=unclassified Shinella TaxID=2643062 RepID=UPI00234F2E60|nr:MULTISPECIES: head-tail connector protein [unclassified Shinella]MCO5139289.1 head-tail connector protein [Shinella sp.]MDC7255982.1 head-tail connector protein [Shinella sp. YE25]